jgi:hypothetical protein
LEIQSASLVVQKNLLQLLVDCNPKKHLAFRQLRVQVLPVPIEGLHIPCNQLVTSVEALKQVAEIALPKRWGR